MSKIKNKDILYIRHILDSIFKIEEYTENIDINLFLSTSLIQDAVIRQLEIIGEASNKLSSELKKSNTDIPWKDIIGMRNKLIHGYFGVDIEAVWYTILNDIPKLKKQLSSLL